MESQKFRMARKVIYDGTKLVTNKLNHIYSFWDKHISDQLNGREVNVTRNMVLIDYHGGAGSFWKRAYDIYTGQKRIEVIPAPNWNVVTQNLQNADILSVGVGSIPMDMNMDIFETIELLIGRTPLVLGRIILPHLRSKWDILNIYQTTKLGTPGKLVVYGWDEPLNGNTSATTASLIPSDGLASDCAAIVAGEGDHRFYVALAPLTFITSLGIGISPNQATAEELFIVYEALQQWFAPKIQSTRSALNSPLS